VTSATAARWGQTKAPSHAFALFTPDRVPATTPTTTDLEYASLWYTDDAGAVTNTAVHGNIEADRSGTGDWLVDTIWYDEQGNVSQTLDAAGRARVLASDPAGQAATAEQQSAFTHYSPDGRRVEDEYGPVHTATLTDGTVGPLRSHTQYVYDDEDPNLGGGSKPALPEGSTAFDLVVETRHSATGPDMVGTFDTIVSRNEYAPVVPGDGNGWLLGAPTVERVQLADGSWSSTITRSDATGRTIETRQPGGATNADGSGSDGRSTILSYYEKNSADPDCSTTLETHTERIGWIGLLCKSSPAGQPTAPSIPLVYYAGFDDRLKPTRVEQRSGSTTRVTTTAYDALERPVTTTVTDGSDTRTTTRTYDATNGLPTGQNAGPKSLTATYDSWGRAWTYTDAWGMRSETSYTPSGEIAAFDDGSGTTTYTYDTAPGEHRRFPGIVKVGLTTGQPDEFLLSYDARGAAQEITYPNGLVAALGFPS
jgi:YD repeat-containing protein